MPRMAATEIIVQKSAELAWPPRADALWLKVERMIAR